MFTPDFFPTPKDIESEDRSVSCGACGQECVIRTDGKEGNWLEPVAGYAQAGETDCKTCGGRIK